MTEQEQHIKRLFSGHRRQAETSKESPFDKLFDREWEEFVVKFDEQSGKFMTQTVCCPMEQVN